MNLDLVYALPAAVPADGLIDNGNDLMNDAKGLLLTVAGAVIAFIVVKFLVKANTFMAALLAIVCGALLFWALGAMNDPTIKKNLDDTVENYGMSEVVDQAPMA